MKSLWALVQDDPVFMRRVNGWATVFWIVMIPVSLFAGWLDSVVYVSALSLWALVSGHLAAWQASRVEVKQEEQHEENDNGNTSTNLPGVRIDDLAAARDRHLEVLQLSGGGHDRSAEPGGEVKYYPTMNVSYFTFGAEHVLPNGRSAAGEYVEVACYPDQDPRVFFMAWLGSNRFSAEYNEREWHEHNMRERFYPGKSPVATILVVERDRHEEGTKKLVDPDCQYGKHNSCFGGPCQCECHVRG